MRSKRASVIGGAATLAVVVMPGYMTTVYAADDTPGTAGSSAHDSAAAPDTIDSRVVDKGDDHIQIELRDKRQVLLAYLKDKGLVARHKSAAGGDWSAPKTIYKTKTESCQGIDARAHGSTVTVTANWGQYRSDGEPPQESIAAVGVGDLSGWDSYPDKGMDGWPPAKIYGGGRRCSPSSGWGD